MSFAEARSPADLRKAMTSTMEEAAGIEETKALAATADLSQKASKLLTPFPVIDSRESTIISQIVERPIKDLMKNSPATGASSESEEEQPKPKKKLSKFA